MHTPSTSPQYFFTLIAKDLDSLVGVQWLLHVLPSIVKKETPDDNITAHNDAFCPSIGPKGRVHFPFQSQLFREKYKQTIK